MKIHILHVFWVNFSIFTIIFIESQPSGLEMSVLHVPFATCAGIGDGHDGRAFAFEFRATLGGVPVVVESGRSKEEHR